MCVYSFHGADWAVGRGHLLEPTRVKFLVVVEVVTVGVFVTNSQTFTDVPVDGDGHATSLHRAVTDAQTLSSQMLEGDSAHWRGRARWGS